MIACDPMEAVAVFKCMSMDWQQSCPAPPRGGGRLASICVFDLLKQCCQPLLEQAHLATIRLINELMDELEMRDSCLLGTDAIHALDGIVDVALDPMMAMLLQDHRSVEMWQLLHRLCLASKLAASHHPAPPCSKQIYEVHAVPHACRLLRGHIGLLDLLLGKMIDAWTGDNCDGACLSCLVGVLDQLLRTDNNVAVRMVRSGIAGKLSRLLQNDTYLGCSTNTARCILSTILNASVDPRPQNGPAPPLASISQTRA